MRVIIVDDEPPARREMRRLLLECTWMEDVGEADGAAEAEALIEDLQPDLIFLDIEMPGASGFDLLSRLEYVPQVVFTTAHDEHAVQAFEVNALDYLLKPIDPRRLAATLDRVRSAAATPAARGGSVLEQLFVRDGSRCWFVPLREVSVFTADGNYVRLQWGKESPMLGRSLVALEEKLDSRRFFRANRRQIVNLDYIESVEMGLGGRGEGRGEEARVVRVAAQPCHDRQGG